MDQQAALHVAAMMNSFRSSGEDIEVRMRVLADRLSGIPTAAIVTACKRFEDGDVEGQSKSKPPTVPEFVQEARKQQGYLAAKASTAKAVTYQRHPSGLAPFQVKEEQMRRHHAGRAVIETGVSYDQWRARKAEFPRGHTWTGLLGGTVFGPPGSAKE